jgi:uncharacterized membrane protein YraQ (UPF0718 family)
MEKKLKTCILISLGSVLALLVSFAFPGIDSFRYDYRKCYANCIVDRFNDLKDELRSGELSHEDAEMYWEEEIDSCDEKCAKKSYRITAAIYAALQALILEFFAIYGFILYPLFISPFYLIYRFLRWLLS